MKTKRIMNDRLFLFLCLILLFVFAGCEQKKEAGLQPEQQHGKSLQKKSIPPSFLLNEVQAPIPVEQGKFNTINGWLNDEMIMYMTNVNLGTNVYTYNIYTGESNLLFESEFPVSSVIASPSGSYILIHTSPNTYEGIISIIDQAGTEVFNKRISAFEFNFEWNPYDESKLLISTFTEEWDYAMYLLDVKEKAINDFENKEPFAFWLGKEEIIYLGWSENAPSLFAPLVKRGIGNPQEERKLNDIYYVKAIKDKVMTITVNAQQPDSAVYTFYSNDFKKLSTFAVPQLSRYSDWLVPFFHISPNSLFAFQPLFSTEADTYDQGFELFSFDLNKGDKNVILEGLTNEPISCSPNGNLCLYGFYYDKLINIETKEIIDLVIH